MAEVVSLRQSVEALLPSYQAENFSAPALPEPLHEALSDMLARLRLGDLPSASQHHGELVSTR
jgi:hypothetical protein